MLIKIIGMIIFAVGIILTVIKEKKNAAVYQYGSVLAKVVEKKSVRNLYYNNELDKLQVSKLMLKFYEASLMREPEGEEFIIEKKLYPVYEYDFQGSPRRMQSYCVSYCQENEFETIYLDSQGNVNDAYIRAGQEPGGEALIFLGLAVLLLEMAVNTIPQLADVYASGPLLFVLFGAFGTAFFLSGVYSTVLSFMHKSIEATVIYNDCEASHDTDDDGHDRIKRVYYPVMRYEHEGKTLWRRSGVGTGFKYKKKTNTIHVNRDSEPYENRANIFKIFFGVALFAFLCFVLKH